MATYTIDATNWNSTAFWSSVTETGAGHTLDFSGLGAAFSLDVNQTAGIITISDGATTFTVGEAGITGTDANLGGATLLDYFTGISGVQGADVVEGTASDNILDGNSGDDALFGREGNDTLYGNGGADTLDGGAGNDLVYGGQDDDDISGFDGDDRLFGETGNDTISGGIGADSIYGGAGADLISGGAGDDNLEGGWEDDSADTIFGDDGNDLIFGYGGDDSVQGGTGNDWIDGGAGDDWMDGGADRDRIIGDLGSDTILGGAGDDILTGGEGADSIDGGGDADQIWGNAGDTIFGGEGGDDNDTLYASHVDFITYTTAESGTITFNSGDTLQFSGIEQIVELTPDGIVQGTSGDDEIGQFYFDADGEWIDNGDAIGESDGDSVRAGDGNDTVWSQDGSDTVHGEAGDDVVFTGLGDNVVFGGAGSDTVEADLGNDTISTDDVVATGPNLIVNGSFEDTTGMTPEPWGFSSSSGSVVGWTEANGNPIEFDNTARDGLDPTDGDNWLDMEASVGQNMVVSQSVASIDDGQVYLLSFDVADFTNGDDGTTLDNQLQVIWNGEVVASIDPPDGSWRSYEFHLIGGSGDGSNTLTFAGSGRADFQGTSLDNVQMHATAEAAGGADDVDAWTGDDDIMTGAGDDTIDAGGGADMIVAGSGADSILGGDGDDTIWGGTGDDVADAGGVQSVVVSEEDFSTAPTGWFDTATGEAITDTAALNDGNAFLGNFAGNGTGAEQVSKTFTMVEGATSAQISFDFLKLDSWDENNGGGGVNEQFTVYIDGDAAFSFTPDGVGTGFGDGADASGSFAGGTWSVTSSGSDTEMFGTDLANWGERAYEVTITLNTPSDTVTLGIGTQLNFAMTDESWGIDNVRVEATGTLPADGNDTIDAGAGDDLVDGGAGDDSILGGDGDDTIRGGEGDDSIHAGHQADLVYGGTGNDTINVGGGLDLAYGDEGDDLLIDDTNAALASTLHGGDGNDTIRSGVDGATGFAEYYGDAGDDRLEDRGGTNQTYSGGTGSDTYVALDGIGNDTVIGGEDPGDTDLDVIDLSALGSGVTVTFTGDEAGTISDGISTLTFSEIEQIILTDGADSVDATADPNGVSIDAAGGDDTVTGSAGADTLIGGDGRNYLFGGEGTDSLVGNSTDDFTNMEGGAGADTLDGSAGIWDIASYYNSADAVNVDLSNGLAETGGDAQGDVLIGIEQVDGSNLGDDTITADDSGMLIKGWGGNDSLTGGASADLLEGDAGNDTLDGGAGDDTLIGGDGDDLFLGSAGADSIDGGAVWWDIVDYSASNAAVTINLADTLAESGGHAEGDTLTGIEQVIGSSFDDVFVASASGSSFSAMDGNDTFFGGAGDDRFWGMAGDDVLYVSGGADILEGQDDADTFIVSDGFGNATLIGGEGITSGTDTDVIDLSALTGPVTVTFSGDETGTITDGTVTLTFSEIERIILGDQAEVVDATADTGGVDIDAAGGDDTVTGGGGDDTLALGDGNDSSTGAGGNDTLSGGGGNDTLSGGAGNDTLSGGTGDDSLFGGTQSDTLAGGDGNDTLEGGLGADVMEGGADSDTFIIEDGFGNDTIIGGDAFTSGINYDTIDLTALSNPVSVLFSGPGAGTITDSVTGEVVAFSGIEQLILTDGDDTVDASLDDGYTYIQTRDGDDFVQGSPGDDIYDDEIFGPNGQGNDTLIGGDGNDELWGGTDDDSILGGAGDDTLNGQSGDDTIDGGSGADSLFGGIGDDSVTGGDGDDLIQEFSPVGTIVNDGDTVTGTDANDSFVFAGDPGTSATILLDDGSGTANDGDIAFDTVHITSTGDGASLTLEGFNHGVDRVQVSEPWSGLSSTEIAAGHHQVTLSYENGNSQTFDIFHDNGSVFDPALVMFTYAGDDTLEGGAGNDTIDGAFGDDSITGGTGDDSILGGAGDDTIGLGDDHGADTILGGEDADGTDRDVLDIYDLGSGQGATVTYTGNEAGEVEFDGTPGVVSTFSEIEVMDGTNEADLIDAGVTTDGVEVYSNWGDDTVIGGSGADTIYAGLGADTLSGGDGADLLAGQEGDDTLSGGAGNDTIDGGSGQDSIVGGDGDDLIIGDDVQGGTFGLFAVGSSGQTGTTGILINGTFNFNASAPSTTVQVTDDESAFEDLNSSGGSTQDTGAPQVLTNDITIDGITYPAGTVIHAVAQSDIVNQTTGETGNAWLIQIGPTLSDNIYLAYDIAVNDGDQIDWTSSNDLGVQDPIYADTSGLDYSDLVQADGQPMPSSDTLSGGAGNDTIDGGAGDDVIVGGTGNDQIFGEGGNDLIEADEGDDTVDGGDGDDTIFGFEGSDSVLGGAGDDFINTRTSPGTGVPDRGYPGAFTGDADTTNDRDTVDGGDGNDTILTGDDSDLVAGGEGDDSIDGGFDDDTITGDAGADTIMGGEGRDSIEGGTGNDLIYGDDLSGTAAPLNISDDTDLVPDNNIDTIHGGDGDDTIFGMDDADLLYGDAGNDSIDGGLDNDTIFGGAGLDRISGGTGDDEIHGGDDADTIIGDEGDDLLFGDGGNDSIEASVGSDTLHGGDGADYLDGGDGADSLTGGEGNDTLLGGNDGGADTLEGGAGDDGISAGGGNDLISGGLGADSIFAAEGDDTVVLEDDFGNDSIDGWGGDETEGDLLDMGGMTQAVTLDLSAGDAGNPQDGTVTNGTDTATFLGIERVQLGTGSDSVTGSAGADSVATGAGADTVDGGAGDDSFDLGAADGDEDLVRLSDGDGNDTVTGFEAPIDNGDGTFTGQDQLDVAGLTDPSGNPVSTEDVTVTDTNGDGSGDAILAFPDGTSITLAGVSAAVVSSPAALEAMGIPAFTGDFIVEGTAGDDLIDAGYIGDPDGDRIDNSDAADGSQDDVVLAGDGADTVFAGAGADSVSGDAGDDQLHGGIGDDTLSGGTGNDLLEGDAGDDLLLGDDGDDTLRTASGHDTLDGGEGSDTFVIQDGFASANVNGGDTGSDIDTLDLTGLTVSVTLAFAGDGQGTVDDGTGTVVTFTGIERVLLPDEADVVSLVGDPGGVEVLTGGGNDTVTGGNGGDTVFGQGGDDSLLGGEGDDSLGGDEGADTLEGGLGADTLAGDAGADSLVGGDGDDQIFAGTGDDTMIGGAGNDLMSGGDDADTFIVGPGDGNDTIDGGEGGTDNDTLIVTGPATIIYDANPENGTVTWLNGDTLDFSNIETVDYIPCFTPGTLIKTLKGEIPVEDLRMGDMVLTRDNGYQPIRWVGRRDLTRAEVAENPALRPVILRANALGPGLPERDTRLSPQHRVMIEHVEAELWFGEPELLVPAAHLTDLEGVTRGEAAEVSYIHFMFDRHEVVMSDGLWTESFQPGMATLGALDTAQRDELLTLFPDLGRIGGFASYASARRALRRHESRLALRQFGIAA